MVDDLLFIPTQRIVACQKNPDFLCHAINLASIHSSKSTHKTERVFYPPRSWKKCILLQLNLRIPLVHEVWDSVFKIRNCLRILFTSNDNTSIFKGVKSCVHDPPHDSTNFFILTSFLHIIIQ